MKAVRYHNYGDADVLRYEDVDRPTPAPGQVLVKVAATAFNPVDAGIRAGYLQTTVPLRFPHTPGLDVAGTVTELGHGVDGMSVGDAVIGFLPMTADGAAADFVVAPAEVLTAAPRAISLTDAAALPSPGLTAFQAIFQHAGLQAGQRILINGAGGAVGGFAVQLAKQAGAVVVATASPRSAEAVRTYGADQIVDYTATSVLDAVVEPVDVVLNLVQASPSDIAGLHSLLDSDGVLVTTVPAAADSLTGGGRVVNMFVRSDAHELAELVAEVDNGQLHVRVDASLPLADLRVVHERSAAGQLAGKTLLIPDG